MFLMELLCTFIFSTHQTEINQHLNFEDKIKIINYESSSVNLYEKSNKKGRDTIRIDNKFYKRKSS